MPRQSDPPIGKTIASLPRPRWRQAVMAAAILAVLVIFVVAAGPLAALLLRVAAILLLRGAAILLLRGAAILLSVAVIAGIIAFAAFRIGIAPHLRSRPSG